MESLEYFINDFYEVISFDKGEPFKGKEFKKLFHPKALLFEKTSDGYNNKTVDEHIRDFEVAINQYPELFINGFHEQEIKKEIIDNKTMILVASHYEKTYSRGGAKVTEYGVNHFSIIKDKSQFRIISVIW